MREHFLRLFFPVVAALLLGCSGDSNKPSPSQTSTATSTAIAEATATVPPTSTPAPEPSPTEEPWMRPVLEPVDRSQPITQPGAYLLDVDDLEVWYIGRGGTMAPDGRALASGYCCVGREGVTIQEIPSGKVTDVPVVGDVVGLTWSPDSTRLAFIVITPDITATDGERALHVVGRDGSERREVVVTDATGAGWVDEVRWVSDDAVVMVQRSGNDPARPVLTYTRVDLANGQAHPLVPGEGGADDPLVLFGERSPDGARVAYVDGGLYVWDSASAASTLIDDTGFSPIWSPDGSQLLFAVTGEPYLRHPDWRLYDLRTRETVELPDLGLWAQWLPDGRLLHAGWWCNYDGTGGVGGVKDVTLQTVDASEVLRLTDTPEIYETEVEASPAGDLAVFVPLAPRRTLDLVDLKSGSVQTVVRGPDDNAEPIYVGAWSSDERYLTFSFGFAHGLCD